MLSKTLGPRTRTRTCKWSSRTRTFPEDNNTVYTVRQNKTPQKSIYRHENRNFSEMREYFAPNFALFVQHITVHKPDLFHVVFTLCRLRQNDGNLNIKEQNNYATEQTSISV